MFSADKCMLAENHLRFLYGQCKPSDGVIAIYTRKPYQVRFFSVGCLGRAARAALRLSETRDVYHLVNLVSSQAVRGIRRRHGRGREAEIQSVVALVCEIDTARGSHKGTLYPSQDVALSALFSMPLRPSMVNLSGLARGGLHAYWVLKQPVSVEHHWSRRRIKAISKAWQERLREALSPKTLDSTFDLARVLRVAGCRNHKYEQVVTRPLDMSGGRYVLEDFVRHVELGGNGKAESSKVEIRLNDRARAKRCRRYLERVPDAVSGKHGHNKTFRAACECFRFGLTQPEAAQVMEWFNQEKTPAEDKWSEAELAHKVESAFRSVWRSGQFGMRVRS